MVKDLSVQVKLTILEKKLFLVSIYFSDGNGGDINDDIMKCVNIWNDVSFNMPVFPK